MAYLPLRVRALGLNRKARARWPVKAILRGRGVPFAYSASAWFKPQDVCPMTERVQAIEVMACLVSSSSDVF
jgi:hypothetical protein